jgi:hypothetical protein
LKYQATRYEIVRYLDQYSAVTVHVRVAGSSRALCGEWLAGKTNLLARPPFTGSDQDVNDVIADLRTTRALRLNTCKTCLTELNLTV